MKLSKAVKAHLVDAEEKAANTFGDLQCAWDVLSDKAQESELGDFISDLMDRAEALENDISELLSDEEENPEP